MPCQSFVKLSLMASNCIFYEKYCVRHINERGRRSREKMKTRQFNKCNAIGELKKNKLSYYVIQTFPFIICLIFFSFLCTVVNETYWFHKKWKLLKNIKSIWTQIGDEMNFCNIWM